MSGDGSAWELFGHPERQPDWGEEPEPAKQEDVVVGFSWVVPEDRADAAEFEAVHKHGEIRHVRSWAGHHSLQCTECLGLHPVDVMLSAPSGDRVIEREPDVQPFTVADVVDALRAVDQRLRRVEQALSGVRDGTV